MNGFFTDNQTKQKAYDRYYNSVAKSDFVQGRKLKALIHKENLDEASADSLANLFQQVMTKTRDYEYDEIMKKLKKAPTKPIKGEESSEIPILTPVKKKTTKKATPIKVNIGSAKKPKLIFQPTVTDSDVAMATPPRKSSPQKNFEQKLSEIPVDAKMASPPKTPPRVKDEPMRSPTPVKVRIEDAKMESPEQSLVSRPQPSEQQLTTMPPLSDRQLVERREERHQYFEREFKSQGLPAPNLPLIQARLEDHGDIPIIDEGVAQMADEIIDEIRTPPNRSSRRRVNEHEIEEKVIEFIEEEKFEYLDDREKQVVAEEIANLLDEMVNKVVEQDKIEHAQFQVGTEPMDEERAKKQAKSKKQAGKKQAKRGGIKPSTELIKQRKAELRVLKAKIDKDGGFHTTPTKDLRLLKEAREEAKRKREETPQGQPRTNQRSTKAARPTIVRNLKNEFDNVSGDSDEFMSSKEEGSDDDMEAFDRGVDEEIKQREYNQKRHNEAAIIVNHATTPSILYNKLKQQFGKEINEMLAAREGKEITNPKQHNFFTKDFPKPHKDRDLAKYKKEMQGLLKGIYLYT